MNSICVVWARSSHSAYHDCANLNMKNTNMSAEKLSLLLHPRSDNYRNKHLGCMADGKPNRDYRWGQRRSSLDLSCRLANGVAYRLIFSRDGFNGSYLRRSVPLGVRVYVSLLLYRLAMRPALVFILRITVAPPSVQKPLSYLSGWLSALGWHSFIAAASFATGNIILILAQTGNPSYTPTAW